MMINGSVKRHVREAQRSQSTVPLSREQLRGWECNLQSGENTNHRAGKLRGAVVDRLKNNEDQESAQGVQFCRSVDDKGGSA